MPQAAEFYVFINSRIESYPTAEDAAKQAVRYWHADPKVGLGANGSGTTRIERIEELVQAVNDALGLVPEVEEGPNPFFTERRRN